MDNKNKCSWIEEIKKNSPRVFEAMLQGKPTEFDGHIKSCSACSARLRNSRIFDSAVGDSLKIATIPQDKIDKGVSRIFRELRSGHRETSNESFFERIIAMIGESFRRPVFAAGIAVVIVAAVISFYMMKSDERGGTVASKDPVSLEGINEINKPAAVLPAVKTAGTIVNATGKIIIARGANKITVEGGSIDKTSGYGLAEGDAVETSAGANCQVSWGKGIYSMRSSSAAELNNAAVSVKKGEIAFKFPKNTFSPANPFVIETSRAKIYILGTELIVTAGSESAPDAIQLITGKIGVSMKNEAIPATVKLDAGQKIMVYDDRAKLFDGAVVINEISALSLSRSNAPRNISETSENQVGLSVQDIATQPVVINANTGETSYAPETSGVAVQKTRRAGFPDESQWLKTIFTDMDKFKQYKNYTREQIHEMYLKAREEYEKQ